MIFDNITSASRLGGALAGAPAGASSGRPPNEFSRLQMTAARMQSLRGFAGQIEAKLFGPMPSTGADAQKAPMASGVLGEMEMALDVVQREIDEIQRVLTRVNSVLPND